MMIEKRILYGELTVPVKSRPDKISRYVFVKAQATIANSCQRNMIRKTHRQKQQFPLYSVSTYPEHFSSMHRATGRVHGGQPLTGLGCFNKHISCV